ncbi:MAG: hypothetical protein BZ136_03065 [Methanosphaera sp. rholeuAM74]|nr:MAG: hypothetical protein BZ136_03065 [Methanosphaera sp. rholeuAM74]
MKIKAKMIFEYESKKDAKIAYNCLYPDNIDFVETNLEDNLLICNIESDKLSTFLNTFEDLIQCEKVVEITSKI